MFLHVKGEVKLLCGTWKKYEFRHRNICKLLGQVISHPNGLFWVSSYRKLCNFNPGLETCTTRGAVVVGKEVIRSGSYEQSHDGDTKQKLVKVAVVGTPNAGKSTFINQLVKRRVCSISSKVHTTRCRARAILNEGNTQVVFLDTPGLVNASESKRHNLEKSFFVDAELCMEESDLVVVIHDASNIWTRDRLDFKVLRLLHLYCKKPAVLVMNKVDSLRSKRKLLDLTQSLTSGSQEWTSRVSCVDECNTGKYNNNRVSEDVRHIITPKDIDKMVKNETGWPNFENVFMISALRGDGVDEVKEFILQKAKWRSWQYPSSMFTDQKIEDMILLAVREKLLENLPQEIPYNIETELEHFNISAAGDVAAVVLVKCEHTRHAKMLLARKGSRIRVVAKSAEEALESTLMENVRLNLIVKSKN